VGFTALCAVLSRVIVSGAFACTLLPLGSKPLL
jgi:hypothetical protein